MDFPPQQNPIAYPPPGRNKARHLWWWRLFFWAALFLVLYELHSHRQTEADFAFADGRKAYSDADYNQAIADFSAALRLQPDDAEILGARGLAYIHLGDNDRAMADFNEAKRIEATRLDRKTP
jgi:tetratricopeptide (TPR) repeat protein